MAGCTFGTGCLRGGVAGMDSGILASLERVSCKKDLKMLTCIQTYILQKSPRLPGQ